MHTRLASRYSGERLVDEFANTTTYNASEEDETRRTPKNARACLGMRRARLEFCAAFCRASPSRPRPALHLPRAAPRAWGLMFGFWGFELRAVLCLPQKEPTGRLERPRACAHLCRGVPLPLQHLSRLCHGPRNEFQKTFQVSQLRSRAEYGFLDSTGAGEKLAISPKRTLWGRRLACSGLTSLQSKKHERKNLWMEKICC